jgi:hypothetical protein
MQNTLRNSYIFGESTITSIVTARNPQHLAVIAQIHLPSLTEDTGATEDRRVKGHPFSDRVPLYAGANLRDHACRLVAHDQRGDSPASAAI